VQKRKPYVILIQETKLQEQQKTPMLEQYSSVRCDRPQGNSGGGLLTYVHSNLQFRELTNFQTYKNGVERSVVEIRDRSNSTCRLANIYIPPRDINADQDEIRTNQCIQELLMADTILAGDVNVHAPLWHSSITDARGIYIELIPWI
jgi:exonuclease III